MELIEYLEKLEVSENKKEWDQLLEISEEAINNFPYSQTLKIYRIKALIEKERLNEAKLLCEDLIRANPGSAVIHSLLARIYEKKGDYVKAIDEHNKILFLNPGDSSSLSEIERLKKLAGEYGNSNNVSSGELLESASDNILEDKEDLKEVGDDSVVAEKEEDVIEEKEKKEEVIEEKQELFIENEEEEKEESEREVIGDTIKEIEDKEELSEDATPKEEFFNEEFENIKNEIGEEEKKENIIEKSDDDLYATISMAKVLEKQGKYYESQEIYFKVYNKDLSEEAKKGYQRTGLKIYKKYLESLNRRLKTGV